MIHLTIPVAELRPGDEWYSETHAITIETIEAYDDPVAGPMVRLRSMRRAWCWPSMMNVDVRRKS
jgi:hypothetical protein